MSFWDNVKKFAQPYADEDYDDYEKFESRKMIVRSGYNTPSIVGRFMGGLICMINTAAVFIVVLSVSLFLINTTPLKDGVLSVLYETPAVVLLVEYASKYALDLLFIGVMAAIACKGRKNGLLETVRSRLVNLGSIVAVALCFYLPFSPFASSVPGVGALTLRCRGLFGTLGTGDIGIGGRNLDGTALLLLLNGVGSIGFCLLYIGLLLQFCLTDSQGGLLFGDLHVSLDLSVVGFLGGLCLGDGDVAVSLCLCDGSTLLNLGNIINTQVFNDIVLVGEGLDIEGDHFQAHLHQVRNSILLNALTEGLPVNDHFLQLHLADDLTHIAFQGILHTANDHFLALV